MVKSLVSKLSNASNLSIASTLSAVSGSGGGGGAAETNYAKHRNDPGRFFGDGVKFKAKLIGILEVGEARGDRMCQEALQDLKMALRAAGEHKQRITIHVTIDGLRLRDEKTNDSLYHHPVHKISFIAQDMTDSRAFGYIFGSPDSGHRFFGIKTDKAASQVVLAMRDLFQVVFELKKKEIELARQQIQSKTLHEHQLASLSSLKAAGLHNDLSAGGSSGCSSLSILGGGGNINGQSGGGMTRLGVNLDNKGAAAKEMSPESVADLVDLEQELSSIQRGITQMERITPNEPPMQPPAHTSGVKTRTATDEDPFGDSFTNFPTYNLLPPPESGRSRQKSAAGGKLTSGDSGSSSNTAGPAANHSGLSSLLSPAPTRGSPAANCLQHPDDDDDSWLNELHEQQQQQQHTSSVFDTTQSGGVAAVLSLGALVSGLPMAPLAASESSATPTQQLGDNSSLGVVEELLVNAAADGASEAQTQASVKSDAFTDLDPLGTGRTRPYVDKKYFFQELKNPPKKVLKELSAPGMAPTVELFQEPALFDGAGAAPQPPPPSAAQSQATLNVTNNNSINNNTFTITTTSITNKSADDPGQAVMPPRDTDPFSPTRKKSDPFQEGGDVFGQLDPFEFEFAQPRGEQDGPLAGGGGQQSTASPTIEARLAGSDVFNGPLQVSLPPETAALPGTLTTTTTNSVRSRPIPSASCAGSGSAHSTFKHPTMAASSVDGVLASISGKKMPHLFGQSRFTKRSGGGGGTGGDSNSINMRRLQESGDSLSETEAAPEPPPRPDSATHAEPPPLPPKKQFNDIVIRPRVTSSNAVPPPPPPASASSGGAAALVRYEYLSGGSGARLPASGFPEAVPPIPLPSRRIGRSDGIYPGPGRPRKPGHTEDDYLAPIASASSGPVAAGDVPPLLPPPTQTSTRARAQRQQSLNNGGGGTGSCTHDIYENKTEILQHQQQQQQQNQQHPGAAAILPDITLTQLLTLGIDELAVKLNVPTSKLSTMTLVELTSYLAAFIEHSQPTMAGPLRPEQPTASASAIFKVNFDQQSTFVAKFDDTFGEEEAATLPFGGRGSGGGTFVANFAQFAEPPLVRSNSGGDVHRLAAAGPAAVPPADRYAVFREIIDQELQNEREDTDLLGSGDEFASVAAAVPSVASDPTFDAHFIEATEDFLTPAAEGERLQPPLQTATKIDTKITDVVAQAKDRYAALRDIILVENLFDKQPAMAVQERPADGGFMPDFVTEFGGGDEFPEDHEEHASSATTANRAGLVDSRGFAAEPSSSALTVQDDDDDELEEEDEDGGAESSLDSNSNKDAEAARAHQSQDQYEQLSTSNQQLDTDKSERSEQAAGSANAARIRQDGNFLTVGGCASTVLSDDLEIDALMQRAISNLSLDSRERTSPAASADHMAGPPARLSAPQQQQFNDVSTSPIPLSLQKSPGPPSALPLRQPRNVCASPPADKSLPLSPIPVQLSAVSHLIDTATKQMMLGGGETGDPTAANAAAVKDSWATFDSPRAETNEKRAPRHGGAAIASRAAGGRNATSSSALQLPPPPLSNTSQNDTAESPGSSDGWAKPGGSGTRRWAKKERHQTSSSSRDLSPWDDETPEYQKRNAGQPPATPQTLAADRHGYYVRHASRRLNSCDEDYSYEDEFNRRERRERDSRKLKQGISRSRDNFEPESPSWYHHGPPAPHHTWSPQDMEQAAALRARSFERSAYERSTYGPPLIYDKRGLALPPLPPPVSGSSYERRSGTSYEKRKYFRDYARPNYDFEQYGDAPPSMYREAGSFEKLGGGKLSGRRTTDYENVYDDGRSPLGYGKAATRADFIYERERDRKSFDRESLESFDSATRRRRSFGSGDIYGSLESRDEFRERYMGGAQAEKTRSLRKGGGVKLRASGDIDYEPDDSENDFHPRSAGGSRAAPLDMRSLQRPSQLATKTGSGAAAQQRLRKSSGSSPWDGDEPPLPGQQQQPKQWKRPSSAATDERRLAPTYGQTPSGSDGEKERRYRRKQRSRGKDLPVVGGVGRYGGNYDYITYAGNDDVEAEDDDEDYADEAEYDEEPPTDEDKFERLNRRRREVHQRMLESERSRQHGHHHHGGSVPKTAAASAAGKKYQHQQQHRQHAGGGSARGGSADYDDEYEQTPTPRSNASGPLGSGGGCGPAGSTKFSFDGGFESDFNQSSPPPAPAGTASSCTSTPAALGSANTTASTTTPAGGTKSSFRFSNDFSERGGEKLHSASAGGFGGPNSTSVSSLQQFVDQDGTPSPAAHSTPPIVTTQKLRFDDNVKVSQFDDAPAFEDDFAKAQFDFVKDEQWHMAGNSSQAATAVVTTTAASIRKHSLRNSKLQQRQELIKKSESINIFAKKAEDPFEDDEFFQATVADDDDTPIGGAAAAGKNANFRWDDDSNFAKFDENM